MILTTYMYDKYFEIFCRYSDFDNSVPVFN